jgi:hypothetical protein
MFPSPVAHNIEGPTGGVEKLSGNPAPLALLCHTPRLATSDGSTTPSQGATGAPTAAPAAENHLPVATTKQRDHHRRQRRPQTCTKVRTVPTRADLAAPGPLHRARSSRPGQGGGYLLSPVSRSLPHDRLTVATFLGPSGSPRGPVLVASTGALLGAAVSFRPERVVCWPTGRGLHSVRPAELR